MDGEEHVENIAATESPEQATDPTAGEENPAGGGEEVEPAAAGDGAPAEEAKEDAKEDAAGAPGDEEAARPEGEAAEAPQQEVFDFSQDGSKYSFKKLRPVPRN